MKPIKPLQTDRDIQNQENTSPVGEVKDRFRMCPLCGTENRYSAILDTHEEEAVETYPFGRWHIAMRVDLFMCTVCHYEYLVSNSLWQPLDFLENSH